MYTKEQLTRAAEIIRKVARKHHVSEKHVRVEMQKALDVMIASPGAKDTLASFQYAGSKPTPEEFLLWATVQLNETYLYH